MVYNILCSLYIAFMIYVYDYVMFQSNDLFWLNQCCIAIMLYDYRIGMSYHMPYDCDVDNRTVKCHFVLMYNIWLSYKEGGM